MNMKAWFLLTGYNATSIPVVPRARSYGKQAAGCASARPTGSVTATAMTAGGP
jgi:hypothetical protein